MSEKATASAALLRLDCLDRAPKSRCDDESDVVFVVNAAQKFYNFVMGDAAARSTIKVDTNGNITGFVTVETAKRRDASVNVAAPTVEAL